MVTRMSMIRNPQGETTEETQKLLHNNLRSSGTLCTLQKLSLFREYVTKDT